ncbi:MAG: 3-hydroxybutyrate dehydrogenase [Sphingopyxis sp.]
MTQSLRGKTTLITGSTSGIGLGYAHALAGAGAAVMLNGFGDAGDIAGHVAALASLSGAGAAHSGADMSKPDEIRAMVADCTRELGAPDILINNAGIQHVAPIDAFPDDKWDAIIAIILSSAFHTTKVALPAMKAKGWGRIINTGSMHSLVASPYKSAYNAAKHGLAGLTKTVALEVARDGITVNCICPGYVWTPLVENQIPDTMTARGLSRDQVINDVLLAAQPQKQFVQIEQLASLMLYLCSDGASAITGANLSMDGGWTAQ